MSAVLAMLVLFQQDPLSATVDRIRYQQDVLSYTIEIQIPDSGTEIRGATTISFVPTVAEGRLQLDFDSVFMVTRVTGAGGSPVPYEMRDGLLTLNLWGPVGDTIEARIEYTGSPADGLFIQQNVHGDRTVFADNWPNRAHHWFPSEDHPSDKAFANFAVEVPAGWSAIANGLLDCVDSLSGGRTRWRWATTTVIPVHTMVIGAGRMAVTQLAPSNGIENSVWVFPADSARAVDGPFRRANDMVDRFADLIGPFPYAKMAHVQSSTRFGGMENSSAIFYSENAIARGTLSEGTVAHEVAHQWFGDAISQTDWHHLWLSEGFATYFAALYYELVGDMETFRTRLDGARNSYFNSDIVDRPVIDVEQSDLFGLLNTNNYQKGGLILHMLRRRVGDESFFSGIRDFYSRYRDRTALSSDFRDVMEAASGEDLDRFFQQWLLQPGYPVLRLDWSVTGDRLDLNASQVQDAAWGLFQLTVPVEVTLDDGRKVRHELEIRTRANNRLRVRVPAEVVSVAIDPDADLLVRIE